MSNGKVVYKHGKAYRPMVFRVQSHYEDGVPEDCTMIKSDTYVELSADVKRNQFMVCLVPLEMTEPDLSRL